jgi:hypothetical protein
MLSKLFKHGISRQQQFEQYIKTAMDYLKSTWSEELAGVSWKIQDVPVLNDFDESVAKWEVDHSARVITIYRLPTERLGSHSRGNALDERLKAEEQVFEAVAELLDVDPWELVPDYYNR